MSKHDIVVELREPWQSIDKLYATMFRAAELIESIRLEIEQLKGELGYERLRAGINGPI